MAVKRWVNLRPQYVDGSGNPLSGGRLFFYQAGSSTKQNTYTDSTGVTANSNPVVLNASGEPSTEIWLTVGQTYKVGLAVAGVDDPPASFLWTEDNISPINDVTVTQQGQWLTFAGVPTFVSGTSFTVLGDQRQIFDQGRRVQTTNTAGAVFSNVSAPSTYDGTRTTVTLTNDSGALDAGLSAVFYGILSAVNSSIPPHAGNIFAVQDNTDNTKRAKFSVAGQATSTTRTLSIPAVFENPNVKSANCEIATSIGGGALTVALKTLAGNDPSFADLMFVAFRNAAVGSGAILARAISAALSVTIPSGTTIGTTNGVAYKIWVGAIDNAGTVELAVYLSQSLTNFEIRNPYDESIVSTTAIAGGANAFTWYSTTARANVPVTVLGYFEVTEAVAGTWGTAPSLVVTNPSERPGQVIQTQFSATAAVATGSTTIPADDTIPQNTEGDQYFSNSITPKSASSFLRITAKLNLATSAAAGAQFIAALFQDAGANAIAVATQFTASSAQINGLYLEHFLTSQIIVPTTFKVRAGGEVAGTFTLNGRASARMYGGTLFSFLKIEEIFT